MQAVVENETDIRDNMYFSTDLLEKVMDLPNPDKTILVSYFGLFDRPKKTLQQIGEEYCKSPQEIRTRIQLSLDRIRMM